MSDVFTYEADELLTEAIMSSTPIIIVEGSDDVPFYEEIVNSLEKEIEVYASENLDISSGKSGCNGVKTCLKEIKASSNGLDLEKYILGIIDKDVSEYRGDEDTDLDGLLILKYYSIESHFINKENVKYLINQMTNASTSLLNQLNLEDEIFEQVQSNSSELYYISLEALKAECETSYTPEYRYSNSIMQIVNDNYIEKLSGKTIDLDIFATSKNITNSFDNLLFIVKGKWFLEFFILKMKDILKDLSTKCNQSKHCQFCKTGRTEQCSFRLLFNCDVKILRPMLFKNIGIEEIAYIKDEINKLSA